MRGCQTSGGRCSATSALKSECRGHPLRKLRSVVDALLATMSKQVEARYARRGRLSVPPEKLLKALLVQILFFIRSERQLVEAINHNLLYRWFVGLNIEDKAGTTHLQRQLRAPVQRRPGLRLLRARQAQRPVKPPRQRRALLRGRHAHRSLGLAQEFQAQGP